MATSAPARDVQLAAVAKINPDAIGRLAPETQIRYVDLAAVSWERGVELAEVKEMSFVSAPSRARRAIRAGDVLVATVRPYLRGMAMVPLELDGAVASTGFAVLRST